MWPKISLLTCLEADAGDVATEDEVVDVEEVEKVVLKVKDQARQVPQASPAPPQA
jgi:hypothetical protein